MEALEKIIAEKKAAAFYTIATCHNPTARHLPNNQRNALYNMAEKYKCYMFVDDVYELLYYDENEERPIPFFYSSDEIVKNYKKGKEIVKFNNNNNRYVISLNSLNKLICPGWRVGWIQCHTDIVKILGSLGWIASGGGICNTMNQFLRSFIELGFLE